MKLSNSFCAVLAVVARGVAAQDLYNIGEEYMAPAAASAMSAMSASYARYVHYTPPPTAADGQGVNVLVKSKTKTSATPTPTACSYWLDNIKHQGVAAFNSDTSM